LYRKFGLQGRRMMRLRRLGGRRRKARQQLQSRYRQTKRRASSMMMRKRKSGMWLNCQHGVTGGSVGMNQCLRRLSKSHAGSATGCSLLFKLLNLLHLIHLTQKWNSSVQIPAKMPSSFKNPLNALNVPNPSWKAQPNPAFPLATGTAQTFAQENFSINHNNSNINKNLAGKIRMKMMRQ
jgi:hypothetical protein